MKESTKQKTIYFSGRMRIIAVILLSLVIAHAKAISSASFTRSDLLQSLQTCHTAEELLERVGKHLTKKVDPDGSIASLVLVRMGKIIMNKDNERREHQLEMPVLRNCHQNALLSMVNCLCSTDLTDIESIVEGTKACASISRIVNTELSDAVIAAVNDFWTLNSDNLLLDSKLEPHHLSGLFWSFETYDYVKSRCAGEIMLPLNLKQAHDDLKLPFRILPGFCSHVRELSVPDLVSQVNFRVDSVRTSSQKVVKERRETAWEGDEGVDPFQYSGKSMPRDAFSPTVERVRDLLDEQLHQYFDCCLLNLYPDGKSAMRYHIDPDQRSLWDFDTVVVSVGASRRFSFRRVNAEKEKPHTFVVMHGDVTHMYGDCQDTFQHAVKKADVKTEQCARASLVFKRSWGLFRKVR
jgi:alkylated DNA repair dioxygenase AlkB